ncbi:MAG TPA: SsrA-binding protein SmpB [bacterium]|nr:SsrA-binding protein SmpB [bacterium]
MSETKPAPAIKVITSNRQARFRYEILSTVEAGLVLTGTEVKSLRDGKCNLKEGYARIDKNEAWLIGVHIPEYTEGNRFNHEPTRTRKLLLSRRQIRQLGEATQQEGLTLVPLRVYFKGKHAKVEIGVGRGKKLYDKRAAIAKRESDLRLRQARHRRR